MKKFLLTNSEDKDELLEFMLSLLSTSLATLEAPVNAQREWLTVYKANKHHAGSLDSQLRITPMLVSPIQEHLSASEVDKAHLAVARRLDNELSVLQRGAMINLVRNSALENRDNQPKNDRDVIHQLNADFTVLSKLFY